ncbi:MAG: DEAD/DEAH box helicase [Candidatus Thermoplasmatota archaeon]|jgi:helicase|nr:DEAD/DEAH box helicase [Candidatus Thermoplasmatota archaeon]
MMDLPEKLHDGVKKALELWKIENLYPPQKEAMGPIADGENLVVAVPTAAGKSLIAYIAIINKVLRGGKALYIVPLRALASEKFEDLKELRELGIKVALSYGDYDEEDTRLERFDVVVATSEKADSLLRHRSKWLMDLRVIVADEVHLINDAGRGPTLEVIMTRFRQLNPKAQLICLSATIGNSAEIANWLGARLVLSDFRPVSLSEGVLFEDEALYSDMRKHHFEPETGNALTDAVLDVVKGDGQVLVFVNTRRSAESSAVEMAKVLGPRLTDRELSSIGAVQDELGAAEAKMLKNLKKAVSGGAAFHHAGLSNGQRSIIEKAFKGRKLKALFATPTLAAGINLPARTVIVRDWTRYEAWNPAAPIPVLEIKQMFGRAGRPRYDKVGEALILARKEEERDFLLDRYVWGKPEEVLSKLGSRPALRMHLLSSFATNYVRDINELWDFMGRTFYAYQNDTWKISTEVEGVLEFLVEEGFLRRDGKAMEATDLGKRVARLYIDPLSAVVMKNALNSGKGAPTPFSLLQVICSTPDLPPLIVRGKDYENVLSYMEAKMDELLMSIPEEGAEYDWFLSSVKTAMFLLEWIGETGYEASEERIETLFNLGPGDIRNKVETAVWLLFSMRELARLFSSSMVKPIDELALRVENGIRPELISLVAIKGIGRVRARRLFDAGIKGPDDIRKASLQHLSSIEGFGRQLALKVQNAVSTGTEVLEEKEEEVNKQRNLLDFSD